MRALPAAALVLLAAGALAAPSPSRVEFERVIDFAHAGKVVVDLDRDVYEQARADLGDLRVLDDRGTTVPYLLQRVADPDDPRFRPPRRLNRGFVRGVSATATLEFEEPVLKSELVLSLPGDNFRRRVKVEGQAKGDRQWTTLTDGAYVFAVPEPARARYETVTLPENNYPVLKVTVYRGPDDPERLEILDVWARPQTHRRPREVALTPGLLRTQEPDRHETVLTLDLFARHQPFRGVVLEVADPQFFRGVAVEARRDSLAAPDGTPVYAWTGLMEGTVYRYPEDPGPTRESLRLDAVGRERALRLVIRNRDDRPLQVTKVTVMVPVERLVFDAQPGRGYRLAYGAPARTAPAYDVSRTVGDAAVWIAQAAEGTLRAPVPRPATAGRLAWTERYPQLLWAGLLLATLLLGTLTWRALREAA